MPTPKVVQGDATATPATVAERMEAVAGRLLGIAEETPEPDEHEEAPDPDETVELDEQPEDDEVDADLPPEDDAEELEDKPADDEPADLHTVKIDGKEEKVTLAEMKAGYSRHRDYTQKTQALAEKDRKVEAEFQGTREARTKLIAVLEQAEIAVKALAPEVEPDWTEMEQSLSAEEVLAAQKSHREYTKRLKVIQDKIEQERQAQYADAQKALEQVRDSEGQKLLELMPQWKDTAKREAGQKAIVDYALSLGFTKEQLRTVSDHRLILLLDKARRLDALKGAPRVVGAGKPGKTGVRTAVPGASTPALRQSDLQSKARERAKLKLAKSGRQGDAAAVFETLNLD